MYPTTKLERFSENVQLKYQLFNSIFITLPFHAIDNTGALLPLFSEVCQEGYKNGKSPHDIFKEFADKYLQEYSEQQRIGIMFRFIQYVERQVVLFDAIEDAAFDSLNNLEGPGSLREIKDNAESRNLKDNLRAFLESFEVRTVLTAHPTQFYPDAVLGIITDLTNAIRRNDLAEIRTLLAQLGKTPFIKKEKPTPYDEALSLIWYLENVFYDTSGEIASYIHENIFDKSGPSRPVVSFGFWPGGDRDGNPFVTTDITLRVAKRLRNAILKCYYKDIRKLRRKLTFPVVDVKISDIENRLYRSVYYSEGELYITLDELKREMKAIRQFIVENHQSLYIEEIERFIARVQTFGYYFATLDIRQNAHIHDKVFADIVNVLSKTQDSALNEYNQADDAGKIAMLTRFSGKIDIQQFTDENTRNTLEAIQAMKTIQEQNGERGCNRFIISNTDRKSVV